jgi:hypothetical protein
VCGTDGLQEHESGLGIVMGHDTKSVRCDPPTEVPARAVGAPELLRGRTVAKTIVLVALSNFVQWGVGRRPRVHKILPPKVARRPLRVYRHCEAARQDRARAPHCPRLLENIGERVCRGRAAHLRSWRGRARP